MANRFWQQESSSSESDSDSDNSDDAQPAAAAAGQPRRAMTRWAEESSSEEEEAPKRTVRSQTDKRYDQMTQKIKQMKNHLKIDDFAGILGDYEAILKMLEKLKNLIEQEGGPPNFFIRAIFNLENYVEKTHADIVERKAKGDKLTQSKQVAFNTLRARLKKGNKVFQEQIDAMKENPEAFASEEEKEDDKSDASSESEDSSPRAKPKKAASSGSSSSDSDSSSSDSSGSSSDSGSDSGSDSDSKSDESDSYRSGSGSEGEGGDDEAAREKKMLRWLITPDKMDAHNKKQEAKWAKAEEEKQRKQTKADTKKSEKQGKAEASDKAQETTGGTEELSAEKLKKKVDEIAQQRGRRGFDRTSYMERLQKLMPHAEKQGPRYQLFIYSCMVSADLDAAGSAFASMKIETWKEALDKVNMMLPILALSAKEAGDTPEKKVQVDDEDEEKEAPPHSRLQELTVAFVEKLDDELYKALQFTVDVYGSEYNEILCNSSKMLMVLKNTFKFFKDTKQPQPCGAMAWRLMEQLYYKPDVLNAAVYDSIGHNLPEAEKVEWAWPADSVEYMGELCRCVLGAKDANQQRLTRRATLCKAYHLALHDHFQAARDLVQLGNQKEHADDADIHTQILYNRVLAAMGLCAFRLGKVKEAHDLLMEVCMHNKARELLAQGLSFSRNNMDRSAEQERAERLRQLPYHMHINLEVLESAHNICAMLLEVPNLAMQAIDPSRNKIISKFFRRALEINERQQYNGPPETPKEAVVSAARSLQHGEWQIACKALEELKIWEHIDQGHPEKGDEIKEMIKEKIKIEALRTYLFAYASIYDAFHIEQLRDMFELPVKIVHSILSKMMLREEITAFWDESSKYVLVQHSEPTPLQRLALTLADRGAQAVQNNEQLVDQKTGGYGFKDQRQQAGGGRWDQDGGKGGKRGYGKGGKDDRGKGKGKGGKSSSGQRPAANRGWEKATRGAAQQGWSTGVRGEQPERRGATTYTGGDFANVRMRN